MKNKNMMCICPGASGKKGKTRYVRTESEYFNILILENKLMKVINTFVNTEYNTAGNMKSFMYVADVSCP